MHPTIEINCHDWHAYCEQDIQQTAIQALEQGQVLILPNLAFVLQADELAYLNPTIVCPKTKNISFDIHSNKLKGHHDKTADLTVLENFLKRYAEYSRNLVQNLFPSYVSHLHQARTSLRPVEIAGRQPASYRKDDTRLHVDAFPANPNQGQRLLRVFTNINCDGKPRVWRIGEPFPQVVARFLPDLRKSMPSVFRKFMKIARITKSYRTDYDHYMLQLHNAMKANLQYQASVPQSRLELMPGTTWIVYTDQVSHAAMSGQHVLEQTFMLPIEAMQMPEHAPFNILKELSK